MNKLNKGLLLTLLLSVTTLSVANEVPSLYVSLEVSFQKTTVAKVIRAISEQTGYQFSYEESLLEHEIKEVTIDAKNEHIENVLNKVFQNSQISYKIANNRIFLKDETLQTVEYSSTPSVDGVYQAQNNVSGIVTDATQEPIIGANIRVKGTSHGVVTNVDGEFSLANVPDGAVIVISYIGFLDQEIKVGSQTYFTIVLRENIQALEEVVIVGYGTQKRSI